MKYFDTIMEQFEVIHALTIRETRTRFGAHKLGYLWALLEPALMILTFYILFAITHHPAPKGMTLLSLIATGICPYSLFASTVNQVSNSISGNKALLFYPQVNPMDLVFARIYLEFVTYVAIFLVLMGVEAIVFQHISVADPLLVVLAFLLASLFGGSLGLVFLCLSQFSNVADRAKGPILRPFFWVSGIFFTVESLPLSARKIALYNPVLHTVELCRAGWFDRYPDTYGKPLFVLYCSLGFLFVGLVLEKVVRRNIEVT